MTTTLGNGPAPGGRTRITTRALARVVAAIAAETLGVDLGAVDVGLDDDHGLLVLTVSAPIRAASLTRVAQDPAVVERTGGPLLARATAAQRTIGERVAAMTGARIGRVTLRLSGTRIRLERHVR